LDFDNMTQGDKRPERFTKGQRLTAAGLNSLTEAVESIMRRMAGQQIVQPLNLQVILGEDLLAAVDTLTDPSTAQANVLRRKTNGDLEITSRSITIVNRFENISVDAGTYAKAEWIEGEWQLYAADCPAMSASASVPAGGGGGSTPPAESL
jgi:hypothetical protein